MQIGLEIITDRSYYYTFETEAYRNKIYSILSKRVPTHCFRIDQLENMTLQWQMKQITNFDYLMHLNEASNRSFSDLSQYPIYPWVISNYESEVLDLNDPKTFRDLGKPIGAINEDRLQSLLERYEGM
jgi:factor associated with neutral sphingomyelinase activation